MSETQPQRYVVEFTVPPNDRDGLTGVKFEDSGNAAIMYAPLNTGEAGLDPESWDKVIEGHDGCFFVRFHSWDERKGHPHPLFRALMGRKVRVTVETIDG